MCTLLRAPITLLPFSINFISSISLNCPSFRSFSHFSPSDITHIYGSRAIEKQHVCVYINASYGALVFAGCRVVVRRVWGGGSPPPRRRLRSRRWYCCCWCRPEPELTVSHYELLFFFGNSGCSACVECLKKFLRVKASSQVMHAVLSVIRINY